MGGCPMHEKNQTKKPVYNVYSQEIDPTNNMPYNPNQEPGPEQRFPLTSRRVQSSIPKGNTDSTWSYPSPQMFYNSMKRKGKGEDVHEGDVTTIVAIHNNMNERTWKLVKEWEDKLHPGSNPKLLRFTGRPDELSPIARMKVLLGGPEPFDRHDWTVQREDGTNVRYIIDYYYDEERSKLDKVPDLHSEDKVKSIDLVVRPAIDSVESAIDRVKFPLMKIMESDETADTAQKLKAPVKEDYAGPIVHENQRSVEEIQSLFTEMKEKCEKHFVAVQTCNPENTDCTLPATGLQHCMGTIVCKPTADAFTKALKGNDEKALEDALDALNKCMEKFEESAQEAMHHQAIIDSNK